MSHRGGGPRPLLGRFFPDPHARVADDPVTALAEETVADVRLNIEYLLKASAPLARLSRFDERGLAVNGPRRLGRGSRAGGGAAAGRSRLSASVLAYGLPEFVGETRAGLRAEAFAAVLRQRLLDHEPRLDPDTLLVSVEEEEDRVRALSGGFGFSIDARLREVDGERGRLQVRTVLHPFRAPEVLDESR